MLLPSPLLPQLPQLLLQLEDLLTLLPHVLLLLPLLPQMLPPLLLLAATAAVAAAQLLLLMLPLLLLQVTMRSWHHGPLGALVLAQTKFAQALPAVDSGSTAGDPEPCDSIVRAASASLAACMAPLGLPLRPRLPAASLGNPRLL